MLVEVSKTFLHGVPCVTRLSIRSSLLSSGHACTGCKRGGRLGTWPASRGTPSFVPGIARPLFGALRCTIFSLLALSDLTVRWFDSMCCCVRVPRSGNNRDDNVVCWVASFTPWGAWYYTNWRIPQYQFPRVCLSPILHTLLQN